MNLIFDTEVFAYNWLVIFKDANEDNWYTFWDTDRDALIKFLNDHTNDVLVGFNVKNYDRFILSAMVNSGSPTDVKEVNDWIISGNKGWDYTPRELVRNNYYLNDLMSDCQQGLSLKAIEAHLYMPITESSVPFDIERPLNDKEMEETEYYCRADISATEVLFNLRQDYLINKINIGKSKDIPIEESLFMTNAKLTARYLGAESVPRNDEREYKYPDNLNWKYIPKEVKEYFDRIWDNNISDESLFAGDKCEITIGDTDITVGFGGVHGGLNKYEESEDGNRYIRNFDVASYYPSLMLKNGYGSRNVPEFNNTYKMVYDTRIEAKHNGDKATANALKLILNSTYGATLDKFNPLYDPLQARSVCISGQLYLLELSNHLFTCIKELKIIDLNTDGVMVSFPKSEYKKVKKIVDEWQTRTGFNLEEDSIKKIIHKDVSNYIEIPYEGNPKIKGAYLVRGISSAGAFNVNNNATIVSDALQEYLINGTPVEDTINNCNDIFKFQLIAKASHKYSKVYQIVGNQEVEVQRCNRVYACIDKNKGTLYKVHRETGRPAKVSGLPEHCLIDNENLAKISVIDKDWYISLTNKQIIDFIDRKDGLFMATTPKKEKEEPVVKVSNVYTKLQKARQLFLEQGVKKSGKNMNMAFSYFELADIIPPATKIFDDLGLFGRVSFDTDTAIFDVINSEKPDEMVTFLAPFVQIKPIVSNSGRQVTNDCQALGASITYIRRYMWMLALDIVEADEIDHKYSLSDDAPVPVKEDKPKAPPTPEKRAEVKKELTNSDGLADDLQVKGLKNALKELKGHIDKDSNIKSYIDHIVLETEKFTKVSKKACESYLEEIDAMLEALK